MNQAPSVRLDARIHVSFSEEEVAEVRSTYFGGLKSRDLTTAVMFFDGVLRGSSMSDADWKALSTWSTSVVPDATGHPTLDQIDAAALAFVTQYHASSGGLKFGDGAEAKAPSPAESYWYWDGEKWVCRFSYALSVESVEGSPTPEEIENATLPRADTSKPHPALGFLDARYVVTVSYSRAA